MAINTPYTDALKNRNSTVPVTQREVDKYLKSTGGAVPPQSVNTPAPANSYTAALKNAAASAGYTQAAQNQKQASTPGFTGGGSTSPAAQTAKPQNISGEVGNGIAASQISAMEKDAASGGVKTPSAAPVQQAPAQSTDYSVLIRDAISAGADADTVQRLLDKRVEKAASDPALNKYAFDDTYSYAKSYIDTFAKPARNDDAEAMAAELKGIYGGADDLYSQALAELKAANNAAVQQAVGRLKAQKDETDIGYADLFRQLYLNKMRDAKNIDQLLADRGITGGAAESTALSMNAGYEEALRQGARDRINTQSELDRAIAEAELTGNISNAEAAAKTAAARADSYADVLRSLISRYDTLYENELARAGEVNTRARNYAYQTALSMLQSGVTPSDELLSEAGINKNDALAMVNYAQGENERALSAASGDTAYKTAMTMLQGGIMPSAALLSAAGISRQDAESIVSAVTAAARTTDPNAYKTAMTMLQSGRMPSDELLAEAGISRQDALSLASVGQTAVKQSSAGTAKTSYNKTQAEAALAAALNGDMSGPVRQIVEGWYGLPLETVIAGSAPQVKYTQAQAETALTAALGGNMSEPVRQIVEGWYGLPLETVLSIYSGDTSAGGGSEPYSAAAPVNTSSAYTPTPPEESLDYDADSGIFRWNGGIYTDIKNLIEAMEDARLSEKTEQVLEKKFASLGWPQTKIK